MIESYQIFAPTSAKSRKLNQLIPPLDLQSHENSRQLFKVGTSATITQRATKVWTTPFPRNSSIIISASKYLHSITKAAAIDHTTRKHLVDLR